MRFLYLITEGGAGILDILQISMYILTPVLLLILPVIVILSIVFTYNKLTETREIIILKNCGLTKLKLLKPAIYFSIVITIIAYLLSLYGIRKSYKEITKIKNKVFNTISLSLLKEGTFVDFKDMLLYTEKNNNNVYENIVIYKRGKDDNIFIQSQKATISNANIQLYNGVVQKFDKAKNVDFIFFNDYVVQLSDFIKDDIETITYKEYSIPTEDLIEIFINVLKLKMDEVNIYFSHLSKNNIRTNKLAVIYELNYRMLFPLIVFLVALFTGSLVINNSFSRITGYKLLILNTILPIVFFLISLTLFNKIKNGVFYAWILYAFMIIIFGISVFLIRERYK